MSGDVVFPFAFMIYFGYGDVAGGRREERPLISGSVTQPRDDTLGGACARVVLHKIALVLSIWRGRLCHTFTDTVLAVPSMRSSRRGLQLRDEIAIDQYVGVLAPSEIHVCIALDGVRLHGARWKRRQQRSHVIWCADDIMCAVIDCRRQVLGVAAKIVHWWCTRAIPLKVAAAE